MLRAIREIKPVWVVGENVRGLTNWNGGMVFDEVQADLENEGYEIIPFLLPACAVNAPHQRERVWFIAYCRSNGLKRAQAIEEINDKRVREGVEERHEPNTLYDNGFVAYSQSLRSNRAKEYENNNFKSRNQRRCNANNSGQVQKWNPVADSNSIKLQGGGNQNGSEKAERHTCASHPRNERTTWENFPTQPPICSGDDGVPEKLDSITFSKWRNESIKAYGNAIVPQVAYNIFKAIEQYELLNP